MGACSLGARPARDAADARFGQQCRHPDVTAFPLVGGKGALGAMSIFWAIRNEGDPVGPARLARHPGPETTRYGGNTLASRCRAATVPGWCWTPAPEFAAWAPIAIRAASKSSSLICTWITSRAWASSPRCTSRSTSTSGDR